MHRSSVWHSSGGDTCHLPRELRHRTHTRSSLVSPLIVSASNHRLALGTKVSAWGEEGWRAGGSGGGGVACWAKGRKGAKSHLELYAFPSLSSIQINWIYVAIVRLKPRTPVMLPRRKSVTFKAKTSTSCLPKVVAIHLEIVHWALWWPQQHWPMKKGF